MLCFVDGIHRLLDVEVHRPLRGGVHCGFHGLDLVVRRDQARSSGVTGQQVRQLVVALIPALDDVFLVWTGQKH